ncbi:DUF362 domain-containing protein [Candidatus Woesearchaeota archaeon]|nr:DUF362 domain-containing protein [Candidatus Woesearchaeota archaeon]
MVTYEEFIERVKKYYHYGKLFDTHHTLTTRNPVKKKNKYLTKEGKATVSIVKVKQPLKTQIKKAIDLIGGLKKTFKKSDSVLLVPNFNSDDPYPASTDPKFLEAVIKILQDYGIKKITIGCTAGVHWLPTRSVLGKMGILLLADKTKVNVVCFEEKDWVNVRLKSNILRDLSFAKEMFLHDKIIYLPCMKTHRRARFTMSIKLTMAFLCIKHRVLFIHTRGIEKKLADLNKAVYPDLIIMDARKIFITGGPDKGRVANLGLLFASGDRAAIDLIGLDYLLKYRNKENLLDKERAEDYDQIKRAMLIGIGIKSRKDIEIIKE